ncbi:uncharacterized protein LOC120134366 [Hibiscus syriacus]|uniref:uncharacterized protein LOC120134366 n=1 Tax=Hibiscus syriacus TaxID=106335 RepID=UPI0019210D35|nr:uncharacterized protein LOC120134366 [Hibiscus syriacus]
MKQFAIQQNVIRSRREEQGSSIPMSVMVTDRGETMVCPKPRRLRSLNSSFNDHPVRSLRWQLSHQGELCDSKPGSDVLDMILTKDLALPPPFFCGSPPSRAANPLIQDARFGDEKTTTPFPLLSPIPSPFGLSSSSPSSGPRKGSCVRANFGNKPAVRIEGFDCLDRDSRNCSIPALA